MHHQHLARPKEFRRSRHRADRASACRGAAAPSSSKQGWDSRSSSAGVTCPVPWPAFSPAWRSSLSSRSRPSSPPAFTGLAATVSASAPATLAAAIRLHHRRGVRNLHAGPRGATRPRHHPPREDPAVSAAGSALESPDEQRRPYPRGGRQAAGVLNSEDQLDGDRGAGEHPAGHSGPVSPLRRDRLQDEIDELMDLAREARQPGWWIQYSGCGSRRISGSSRWP